METEAQVHFNRQHIEDILYELALRQEATPDAKPIQKIEPLLDSSKDTLESAYRVLAQAARQKYELSPAAEWLLDNFYIIQEQIVELKYDLPPSYYKKLPRLLKGTFKGYPRIYELVHMLGGCCDNVINRDIATVAVQAYQQEQTLKLGELWAIPLMVRLALILRLEERSKALLKQRELRNYIDTEIEPILNDRAAEPGYLLRKLSEISSKNYDRKIFLTTLARQLQMQGALTDTERRWFDYKFQKWETSLEEALQQYAYQSSRLHLSIQNSIASLRNVSETDWSVFVEKCSAVEQILRLDPSGTYPAMDRKTRDTYRKVVEKLHEHSSSPSEQHVAGQALELAEQTAQTGEDNPKRSHVGYYLVDKGYTDLVERLNYKMPVYERFQRWMQRHTGGYFLFIFAHLVLFLGVISIVSNIFNVSAWLTAITLGIALMPALELSVVSTNRLLAFVIPPRVLPKLNIEGPVPDESRTMVVVPTMLSSPADVREQLEDLEIRSHANPNKALQFVLLTDFTDAPEQQMPGDEAILETAKEEIKRLNEENNSKYGDRFYLLHRKRLWNPSENKWMGWERKRGKLEEFDRLLRVPDAETSYTFVAGDFQQTLDRAPVKYVLTLDADTQLPPGSAVDLIRTAAHPLNRAELSPEDDFVVDGYGIFQPRISISPKTANQSWFSKIFSGNVGIDPYTTAVSDIYQDLYGEGVFTGKGLYDVEVFERVLGNRFPENTVLSHDLLESTYLRTALVSDIELFDDYPSSYLSYSKRNHRWIRGDWQILSWLFSRVPGREGKEENPVNNISRWKIFDNLRRSLNPLFILLFLLAAWTIFPGSPIVGTLAALGVTAFPIYSSFSVQLFQRPTRVMWKLYFEKVRADLKVNTFQALTTFMIMPHQAYLSLDAIIRTLWRMYVSDRLLLEWTTASQTERETKTNIGEYYQKMWVNVAWSALCLVLSAVFNPPVLFLVAPFVAVWVIAPYLSYRMSLELKKEQEELSEEDIRELRTYTRRTWNYFERFVNEEHSWLAPDNFQEQPYLGAVDRTSPTNMGLALTATYTAYDFGYITLQQLLHRLGNMLGSMKLLERRAGHFYNWYSTKTTEVLNPKYISTVDSGNLAGSLVVVKQGLKQLPEQPWPNPAFWEGLQDTLWVLDEIAAELEANEAVTESLEMEIVDRLEELKKMLPEISPDKVAQWQQKLTDLQTPAKELRDISFDSLRDEFTDVEYDELVDWFARPLIQIESQLDEIRTLSAQETKQTDNPISKTGTVSINGKVREWQSHANELARWCDELVREMDFRILYNEKRKLFSIGYNEDHAALDTGTYDLLASEARLASYIAIAKGDVPPEHWFSLSRRLTSINRNEILLSWGGTMFEYLMPLLYMNRYEGTLLSNTYENAVTWQQNYGQSRSKPWGFSESGYGILNLDLHYQYRAFGAPGLGLRRGLAEDYIVAPYAGMLALMVHPKASLENLRRLKQEGAYGMNGFYEAIDYTPSRGEPDSEKMIIKMYMAHHQGMGLLALANVLKQDKIQQLFHTDLLLQERIPRGIPIKEPRPIDVELEPAEEKEEQPVAEHVGQQALDELPPRTHILSNGEYSTVLTHAGTGYSFCNELALTRWRRDPVKDSYGFFFYIKELESNEFWSVGHQPVGRKADRYDSWFHPGLVQTARVDEWTESFMEVCVSPEDNIELRKLTLTNYANRTRRFELTSYAEVVLNEQGADAAHPAFSNLSIQTEYIPEHHAVIAKRRPRENEQPAWMVHTMASEDIQSLSEPLKFETDRNKFTGRGRTLAHPAAMDKNAELSESAGNISDPILSLQRVVELEPGEKISITFGLGKVNSREEAVAMADNYDNPYAIDRTFELASIYGRMELEHLNLNTRQAHYFYKLAGSLIYGNEALRADENILLQNRKTQSGLWAYGISGDLPIMLYKIKETEDIRTVKRLLRAHALFRLKGLKTDLVIINEHPPSYVDELHEMLNDAVQASQEHHLLNKRGGIFLIKSHDMPPEDRTLLESVARIVLQGSLPSLGLEPQKNANNPEEEDSSDYEPIDLSYFKNAGSPSHQNLQFFNGYGGFSETGREYVIQVNTEDTNRLQFPPAPWINVIANPDFGFLVSESGSGYTWSQNSRENRLTPWSNDAVSDPPAEAIYIRDEDHELYWSPTPNPIPGSNNYKVTHGFGYSRFESETMNLRQELTMWVPKEDPVKIVRLRLTNSDLSARTLSVFRYAEWVLGVFREHSVRHVITELDADLQTIFARNFYNNEFAGRVAFAAQFTAVDLQQEHYSSDRTAFVGRNNDLSIPQVLGMEALENGRFGAGFDSCAASQARFVLDSGEQTDIYFLLGETATEEQAKRLIKKYRDREEIEYSLNEVTDFWEQKLNTLQIQTPVPEFDLLANGWLQYQNIACRIWARTAFYQSGGAYGFRDQLQDVASALHIDHRLARSQILLHAAHQFPEGDVLHWWHPPTDRGTRTRISDDLLWLSHVTALYISRTDDTDILQEKVPFIQTRQLEDDEQEAYLTPEPAHTSATLYEHCCLAIDRSLTSGAHGLPLMGAGDWNDGMNRVGEGGKGESVWLGFFLYTILEQFIPICSVRDDNDRAERYREYQQELKKHLNDEGWDGQWYRRAFYDDGTPLGSAQNEECQIDAIAQSWAAISGAGEPDKIEQALEAADRYLVSEEDAIIRLLTPAFDDGSKDPGYIKGYIPGVRENGGQYTHAATWLIKAFAESGRGSRAVELMQMLTPVNHSLSKVRADRYKVEPYAVAADIYGEPPLTGMGGWTWYTGSAGWMYRVIIESILGITISGGNTLQLNPSVSTEWDEYRFTLREQQGETTYHITVQNPEGLQTGSLEGTVDGEQIEADDKAFSLDLKSDGKVHNVILVIT
jgi:cellobiose phosphorylase